jgi:hypothetical protein
LRSELERQVLDSRDEALRKAWASLAGYKFFMFGYHAAHWVKLNRLLEGDRQANPFRDLVLLARSRR